MKHLELHIIQSVPVACLNRDDLNSPKTAVFGGVQRARVSSQSWKRAIREMAKELAPENFKGERTRLMYEPLVKAMVSAGVTDADADEGAKKIVDELVKLDTKSKDKVKSTTLYFMSPLELETLAKAYAETKDAKKTLKAVDAKSLKDAADISIFGRMVATDHSLTVEAASMFSHALSIHKVDNEIDFFSAVDDRQPKKDPGAAITSTLEFNSATYYRFAALNLDMLADDEHLGCLSREERQSVVGAFVEATIKALPGARKNTMNGNTLPLYVLGVVRENGHPIQLVNAFEAPVRSSQGYAIKSVELMKAEYAKLKETWGIEAVFEQSIPDVNMKTFVSGMVAHVI
ncbi:type I-E CRISPR-associated protein Cas7/Cse4/CasC [Geobacter sp.]|uniref:type I-E CRISPR-associated protein Cas7/Cse4/CasC n=1 Tax=Geobacter sp. TaxID=46610 RepID=UPI00263028CB|nr:type I-E CRISPR-associated protein Cas7/Cse4/CasC [Geobacter sp.]